jgi:hypothetical protein
VAFLRVVAILLGLGIAGCALAWIFTRERKWLVRSYRLLTAAVVTGLVFFGVLLLQRLA